MKKVTLAIVGSMLLMAGSCEPSSDKKDQIAVSRQQDQYAAAQPIPAFDYSLERDLVIQLYRIRNQKVATHTVWRSDYGMIEGDCPSMGYSLPYDTSLTNPLQAVYYNGGGVTIEQPEPNGVFPSKNTSATWVFCIGATGRVEPVSVESKVTTYPGPVSVDYENNRVIRRGDATVILNPTK